MPDSQHDPGRRRLAVTLAAIGRRIAEQQSPDVAAPPRETTSGPTGTPTGERQVVRDDSTP